MAERKPGSVTRLLRGDFIPPSPAIACARLAMVAATILAMLLLAGGLVLAATTFHGTPQSLLLALCYVAVGLVVSVWLLLATAVIGILLRIEGHLGPPL
jgi:hypothetical protein